MKRGPKKGVNTQKCKKCGHDVLTDTRGIWRHVRIRDNGHTKIYARITECTKRGCGCRDASPLISNPPIMR